MTASKSRRPRLFKPRFVKCAASWRRRPALASCPASAARSLVRSPRWVR
ncbi:cellulose biosynthesis protein BcsF [Chromobacterium rhizoryzae]|uniref:Cellulose biosynthesis protein BcsF n=1 Tax=Chromobacterium rhizoryzae TaxID=1778675 RepID=A0AAD0W8Q9_9NEIS|nr:cellulose biosynthesis protein BcsF [Chromobacterium rhizoryzae]